MLDSLKNLANLPEMLRKANEAKTQMQKAQVQIAQQTFTADAGAGRVTATVAGTQQLLRIRIDKSRLNLEDTAMLEDLVVSAVKAAQAQATENIRVTMAKIADDVGLPPGALPG